MTTIKLKNGSGAPTTSDLVQGEPALDLTNKRLYTENASGAIIEVGTNPSTLTVDTNTLVVDATNNRVGIGTASPSYLVDARTASGNAQIHLRSGSDLAQLLLISNDTTGASQINFGDADSNNVGIISYSHNENALKFTSNSAERMRIDSSGNVGIGTDSPPSANNYKYLAVHAPTNAYLHLTNNTTGSTGNDGLDIVVSGLDAALINREAGAVKFHTANTERMRINSSGDVGIGTTSPNGKLDITGSGNTDIYLNTGNSSGDNNRVFFGDTVDIDVGYLSYDHGTDTMSFGVNASERMRIDSSGSVILNQSAGSSDNTLLRITGGTAGYSTLNLGDTDDGNVGNIQYNHSTNTLAFDVNNTERMRIDSSGNLLVGTTSVISGTNPAKQYVLNNTASQTCFQATAGGSHTGIYALGAFSTVQASSGSNVALVVQSGNGSLVNANNFYVYTNGDVKNTNNSYGAISDERLKSNIVDASSQLDDIMAVQVRSYTLNSTGATHIGVVAQELEASGMSGLVKTDDEGMKSVKYSILYLKAIKALQEAVTRIETLEAEVTALKGE